MENRGKVSGKTPRNGTKKQQERRNGDSDVKPGYGKQMGRAPPRVFLLKFRVLHSDPGG